MTINATVPFSSFPGDGSTTIFPVPWISVEADDLIVERVQGVTRVVLNYGSDWNPSVTAAYMPRSVVTTVPIANGWTLEVTRRTDLNQLSDYISNDGFPAETTERALDKVTLALQEQDRRMGLIEGSGVGAGYTFTNIAGVGVGVFAQLVGNDAQFKRLEADSGITLADNGSRILIGSTGVAFPITVAQGGTGQTSEQAAINALTQVSGATNEHVLTKDTATGHALWKAAAGLTPPGNTITFLRGDGAWSDTLTGPLQVESNATTGGLKLHQAGAAADMKRWSFETVGAELYLRARTDAGGSPATAVTWIRGAGPSISVAQFLQSRFLVGSNDDASTGFQVTGGFKLHTGNLTLVANAAEFQGKWDIASGANRHRFKNATLNTATEVTAVPNGSSTTAAWVVANDASLNATTEYLRFAIEAGVGVIRSTHGGSGTSVPISFYIANAGAADVELMRVEALAVSLFKQLGFAAVIDDGTSGTSKTIDWTAGNWHKLQMTGNCTFTFTAPTYPTVVQIELTQDGTGNRTMTLPASVKWTAATAAADKLLSTGASKRDLLVLRWNGTDYLAQLFKDY